MAILHFSIPQEILDAWSNDLITHIRFGQGFVDILMDEEGALCSESERGECLERIHHHLGAISNSVNEYLQSTQSPNKDTEQTHEQLIFQLAYDLAKKSADSIGVAELLFENRLTTSEVRIEHLQAIAKNLAAMSDLIFTARKVVSTTDE